MIWADCAKEEKEMLHKYENFLGLSEDSLSYQMEEYYPVGEYTEEPKDDQEESSVQHHS